MSFNIKEQILTSSNAIKSKLKQLKDIEDQNNYELSKIFKPVTEPLTEILGSKKIDLNVNTIRVPVKIENKMSSTPLIHQQAQDDDLEIKTYNSDSECFFDTKEEDATTLEGDPLDISLTTKYLSGLYEDINIPFGIRKNGDKLMMGNVIVKLIAPTTDEPSGKLPRIKIDNDEFQLTSGLRELLLHKRPKLELVTENDKEVYKNLLSKTNAHKRDFVENGQLKGDKGEKYRQIIKPMFTGTSYKLDGILPSLKRYKRNTDFIYWDDPNELVERLKLLIASKHAGNTNHDNEIISIIEELKEAGIIKS